MCKVLLFLGALFYAVCRVPILRTCPSAPLGTMCPFPKKKDCTGPVLWEIQDADDVDYLLCCCYYYYSFAKLVIVGTQDSSLSRVLSLQSSLMAKPETVLDPPIVHLPCTWGYTYLSMQSPVFLPTKVRPSPNTMLALKSSSQTYASELWTCLEDVVGLPWFVV